MAKKIITIVGVTGVQGGSVARTFLEEGSWHVRGLTRDPSKPSSQAWAEQGVELVQADINDFSSLVPAFAGSSAIFGVTQFWDIAFNPYYQALATATNRTVNEIAYGMEVQQGKNIVDAANATVDTLERFVFSTLSPTMELSGGKYTHNLHHDAKWKGVEYLRATYPKLDRKTSLLQVGLYLTNWKALAIMGRPTKQPDGTFLIQVPIDGDAPVPFVEPSIDTGKFAKALVYASPGKNFVGYGSLISYNQFASLWGKQFGVTCRFERLDRSVLEEAVVPHSIGEELADMLGYLAEFGPDGGDKSAIRPEDLGVPVNVYTAEEYIKNEQWPELP